METFFTEDEIMSVNTDLINCLSNAKIVDESFIDRLSKISPEAANYEILRFLHEAKSSVRMSEIIGAELLEDSDLNYKTCTDVSCTSFFLRNKISPMTSDGCNMTIAVADPFDVEAFDELSRISNKNVVIKLVSFTDLRKLLQIFLQKEDDLIAKKTEDETEMDFKEVKEVAAFDRFFANILESAVRERASDMHFEMNRAGMRVRFRIDGRLTVVQNIDVVLAKAIVAKIKLDTSAKVDESRIPQDKRIRYKIFDNFYDLRVSILPTVYGENIAVRIFDQEDNDFDFNNIGLGASQKKLLEKIIHCRNGLILLCGPTGCGKTTTLYTILKKISSPKTKVVTIEDPVEYRLEGINQVPVNDEIGLTFASVLRSILRQSPNVIMVGEIRDGETAELAIQAALTGHLVFSTIHCSDSTSAISRLLDFNISEHLIRSCLRGAISQRLLRKPCKNCMKLRDFSDFEKTLFPRLYNAVKNLPAPSGCEKCAGRGYNGRLGVFDFTVHKELLEDINFLKTDMILKDFSHVETFANNLIKLIAGGDVMFDDVKQLLLNEKRQALF